MIIEPRTEKGARAKSLFVTTAARLFCEQGFHKCTVDEVCRETGAPVGSFYRYFRSKEDVLHQIARTLADDLDACFSSQPRPSHLTLHGRLADFLAVFFDFVASRRNEYQALRECEFVYEKAANEFHDRVLRLLDERLQESIGQQEPKELALQTLLGVLSFVAAKILIWDRGKVSPAMIADLATLIENGVSGKRGVDLRAFLERAQRCPSPSRSRALDPRDRLLAASEMVFGREGFTAASVAEICRRAKVSVGNFYKYFESKEDAFAQTTFRLRELLIAEASHTAQGASDRLEVEFRALFAFLRFIAAHPHGYRIVREAEFVDFKLAERYYLFLHENYATRIRETARPGEFSVSDHSTLALALMGMGHMLGLRYVVRGKTPLGDELLLAIASQVFLGLRHSPSASS